MGNIMGQYFHFRKKSLAEWRIDGECAIFSLRAKYEATTRADQRAKEAFNPGGNKSKRREGRSEEWGRALWPAIPPNNSSAKMCHPLLCSLGKLTPLNLTLIICESSIKPYGAVRRNRDEKWKARAEWLAQNRGLIKKDVYKIDKKRFTYMVTCLVFLNKYINMSF